MANKHFDFVKQSELKKILKSCDWLLLLGERSNGKSYASKNLAISECIKNDKEFIYLRRHELDTKDSLCVHYFTDVPVEQITDGEYSCIDVWRKGIYLSNIDEKGKIIHGKLIGYCHALNESGRYKSLSFPNVDYILYEEFISEDGRYLFNEPNRLQHYVSTIYRLRKGKVLLIANLLSRIVPYYRDWGLQKTNKQKVGTIEDYVFHNDNGDDTILKVYKTDSLNYNSGMFFGNSAKSITKACYDVLECPHLEKPLTQYTIIYQIVVQYNEFLFLCRFLQDKNENKFCWYVEPKTTEIKAGTRVISNLFNADPLWTNKISKALSPSENKVFRFFNKGNVCYSDNLTGTEFQNIIQYVR